jgi:hypothetical protein
MRRDIQPVAARVLATLLSMVKINELRISYAEGVLLRLAIALGLHPTLP